MARHMATVVWERSADDPFAATYSLTELGQRAAEYGEADFPAEAIREAAATQAPEPARPRKSASR